MAVLKNLNGAWEVDLNHDIGNGMYGTAYKGRNTENGSAVAMKKASTRGRDILEHERKVLENIGRHCNIITLYDSYREGEALWLILDFCDKGDLESYCNKITPNIEFMMKVMLHCATALEFLHCRTPTIIHRDINPTNILLQQREYGSIIAKLGDFGSAKIGPNAMTRYDVRAYTTVGTTGYRAPEIFLNQGYDASIDVFSLGLVMYALIRLAEGKTKDLELPHFKGNKFIGQIISETKENMTLEIDESELDWIIEIIEGMIRYKPHDRTDIEEVVRLMNGLVEDLDLGKMKEKFIQKFGKAKEKVLEVANMLDKQNKNAKKARIVFAAGGATGGTIATVGLVAMIFTAGTAIPVIIAIGTTLNAICGVGSLGTVLVDKHLSEKKFKVAQESLHEYRRYLKWYLFRIQKKGEKRKLPKYHAKCDETPVALGTMAPAIALVNGVVSAESASVAHLANKTFNFLQPGYKVLSIGGAAMSTASVALNIYELLSNCNNDPSTAAEILRAYVNEMDTDIEFLSIRSEICCESKVQCACVESPN